MLDSLHYQCSLLCANLHTILKKNKCSLRRIHKCRRIHCWLSSTKGFYIPKRTGFLHSTTTYTNHFDQHLRSVVINPISFLQTKTKSVLHLCLLQCGDVQLNPGPTACSGARNRQRQPKHPFTVCVKGVISTSKAVVCESCNRKTHIKCTGDRSTQRYDNFIQNNDLKFYCTQCSLQVLPHNVDLNESTTDDLHEDNHHSLPSGADNDHFQCFSRKGVHFIHLNARSLHPKIDELRIIAAKSKAAVISITETWLDESATDGEISVGGYCVVRKDRNRNGGGVCTFIWDDFAF